MKTNQPKKLLQMPAQKSQKKIEIENKKKIVKQKEDKENTSANVHNNASLYVVRQKGGEKQERTAEVQKRVGQANLASKEKADKKAGQRRVPPQVMKLAKQIWQKSAQRPEGQLTQQQALGAAVKLFRQRQAEAAAKQKAQAAQNGNQKPQSRAGPAMKNNQAQVKPQAPVKTHQWSTMNPAEKGEIFKKLSKVYHMNSYPDDLLAPVMTNTYSLEFKTGAKSKSHKAEIDGCFPNDSIHLAKKCNKEVSEVLSKIGGINQNIFIHADVGNDFGYLHNVTNFDHPKPATLQLSGEWVTLLVLWKSDCKFSIEKMDEL